MVWKNSSFSTAILKGTCFLRTPGVDFVLLSTAIKITSIILKGTCFLRTPGIDFVLLRTAIKITSIIIIQFWGKAFNPLELMSDGGRLGGNLVLGIKRANVQVFKKKKFRTY